MSKEIVPVERIAQSFLYLRGPKLMLSQDLAALYSVAVKALSSCKTPCVSIPLGLCISPYFRRVREFEVTNCDFKLGRVAASSSIRLYRTTRGDAVERVDHRTRGKRKHTVMRAFVKLRETLETNRELARKFAELERRVGKHDEEIATILEAIRQLMAPPERPRREIGFHVRKRAARYRAHRCA